MVALKYAARLRIQPECRSRSEFNVFDSSYYFNTKQMCFVPEPLLTSLLTEGSNLTLSTAKLILTVNRIDAENFRRLLKLSKL